MSTAEDPRAAVDAVLADHVAALRAALGRTSTDAAPLADAVQAMLSGGKRLRAAFAYWSWRAHGGDPGGPGAVAVAHLGAALELFQAAALFHDDVMDDSDTRRGRPSAHRAAATAHAAAGWAGDPRRFGESAAILLGDLAVVGSDVELGRALVDAPADRAQRVREVFDLMRAEVTVGQYLDLVAQAQPWGTDPGADEARARDVIRAKSARYSVEHPLVLGALLAGAGPADVAVLAAVGLPLGEAFQLRDDLLGVLGDPAVTGKPAGDDLREGKRTVLIARAAARATAAGDQATVQALAHGLGDRDADAATVARLTALVVATGAVDDVERLIGALTAPAFAAMAARAWPEPAASRLLALAHAAVDRRA